eukprot:6207380-Pleurochrysis_carterae.AAC.1
MRGSGLGGVATNGGASGRSPSGRGGSTGGGVDGGRLGGGDRTNRPAQGRHSALRATRDAHTPLMDGAGFCEGFLHARMDSNKFCPQGSIGTQRVDSCHVFGFRPKAWLHHEAPGTALAYSCQQRPLAWLLKLTH